MSAEHDARFSLAGRAVLVAGASRGIGAAIARGMSAAGARVTACGRSAKAAELPATIAYECCDVTDEAAFERVCGGASVDGRLHAFVFAAGITRPVAPGEEQTAADFAQTLALNLTAAYACARTAARSMQAGGSIVFVTSINAALGFPGNPGYVASKGGLRQLARAMAVDLGARGIRVNTLAPGYVRTAMTEASYVDPERRAARASRTILGRWGEPDDLAGPAVFLASDAAAYITGQDLYVDGGWTAKGL